MPESCDRFLRMAAKIPLIVSALASAFLCGCAASDDASGRFLVQPDRYQLYSCRELADVATNIIVRQRELEGLMAKAGPDASGRFVSSVAYRPEYLQLHGQRNEVRNTAGEKKCKFNPDTPLGARVSDQAIR